MRARATESDDDDVTVTDEGRAEDPQLVKDAAMHISTFANSEHLNYIQKRVSDSGISFEKTEAILGSQNVHSLGQM